jgi:hypothetical protein
MLPQFGGTFIPLSSGAYSLRYLGVRDKIPLLNGKGMNYAARARNWLASSDCFGERTIRPVEFDTLMSKILPRRCLAAAVTFVVAPIVSEAQVPDALYVGLAGSGTGGNAVDLVNQTVGGAGVPLVSGLDHPAGLALAGNDLYVASSYNGVVGEYNATTGVAINASLLTLTNGANSLPGGMAVSGNMLYVVNGGTDTVAEYNATTGATINASLVQNLVSPFDLALSGSDLYVSEQFTGSNQGKVVEFNINSGDVVNSFSLTTTAGPQGLAVSGNTLFLVNNGAGTIGSYNATTGAAIDSSLVSGLSGPAGVAVVGNDLYVALNNLGTVGEYNATTGAAVPTFISPLDDSLNGPTYLAVEAVPEPSTWALLSLGSVGLFSFARRRFGLIHPIARSR